MPEGLPDAAPESAEPAPSPAPPSLPSPPATRFRPGIAWAVIGLVIATILAFHHLGSRVREGSEKFALELMRQQVQAQYGVKGMTEKLAGASPLGGSAVPPGMFLEQIRSTFGSGTVAMRQRLAVVAGDLEGPAAAIRVLDETEKEAAALSHPVTPEEQAVQRTLRSLYGNGKAHTPQAVARLPDEGKDLLRGKLDWFGALALAPEGSFDRAAVLDPAQRRAVLQLLLVAGLLVVLLVGFVGALIYWILVLNRGPRFKLEPGAAPHAVYAETFAVWMILFLGLSLALEYGARLLGARDLPLIVNALPQFGSLAALAWPGRRGIPWETVRSDLGLRLTATPFRDAAAGIACWFMATPVMAAAMLVMVALMLVLGTLGGKPEPFAPPDFPSHPIVGEAVHPGSVWGILFLASVGAPLVEEIFFRGVLYRHLRDATGTRGRWASIAFSTLFSGFVFAVIHPQGLIAVPVLMSVAACLVHAREWRGSLVAPMAAHAWHNALATIAVVSMFG